MHVDATACFCTGVVRQKVIMRVNAFACFCTGVVCICRVRDSCAGRKAHATGLLPFCPLARFKDEPVLGVAVFVLQLVHLLRYDLDLNEPLALRLAHKELDVAVPGRCGRGRDGF